MKPYYVKLLYRYKKIKFCMLNLGIQDGKFKMKNIGWLKVYRCLKNIKKKLNKNFLKLKLCSSKQLAMSLKFLYIFNMFYICNLL